MAYAYEVYCYYNVDTLNAVFNGVAMILNSGGYANLIKTVMTLGVIIMAMVSLSSGKFEGMKWFFVSAIFYIGFLGPKTNVMLVDRLSAQPPAVVANVPLGLAFMAHFTSSIGDWMTTTMESAFTVLPSSLTFVANPATASYGETHGVLFGSKLLTESRRSVISDPDLRMDWYAFIRNCTLYDISAGRINANALQTTNDIITMLGNTSVARMTTQNAPPLPAMDSCINVYANLKNRMNIDVQIQTNTVSRLLNPNGAALASPAIRAIYNQQATDVTTLMMGVPNSQSASTLLSQASMINLMDSSGAIIGQQLNDPASVSTALAQAQAEATANSSYLNMAKVAESAMPKIRNVIEVVVYATFPIVMLIILVAGHRAGVPLKAYFMTMVWLQLWPPLYAILNLVVTMETAKEVIAAAAAHAGGGLSIASAADIGQTSLSAQAIAGYMVMLIPVIAGAITKGGEQAMSSLAGSLTAPVQQAATTAGTEAAKGNWNLDNSGFDNHTAHNTSANKLDTNMSVKSDMSSYQAGDGSMVNHAANGSVNVQSAANALNFNSNVAQAKRLSDQHAFEDAAKHSKATQASLVDAKSAAFSSVAGFTEKVGGAQAWASQFSSGSTAEAGKMYETVSAIADKISTKTGTSKEEAAAMAGVLAAGGTAGNAISSAMDYAGKHGGASAALRDMAKGLKGESKGQATITGKHTELDEIAHSSDVTSAIKQGNKFAEIYAKTDTGSLTNTTGKEGSNGVNSAFQKLKTAQLSATEASSREQATKNALANENSWAASFQQDFAKDPERFRAIAEANPWVDADGGKHSWNVEAYANADASTKRAMEAAFLNGMGIDTSGTAAAANLSTGDVDKAQKQNDATVAGADAAHDKAVGTQARTDAARVERERDKQHVGTNDGNATTGKITRQKSYAAGGLMKISGNIESGGFKLGEHKAVFDDAVTKNSSVGAFSAMMQAAKDNPMMAAAIAAPGAAGELSRMLGGILDRAHPEGGIGGTAKEIEKAVINEVKNHPDEISRLKDIMSKVREARGVVRAAEVAQAAMVGLAPAAVAEAVVTEAAFMVIGSMLEGMGAGPSEASAANLFSAADVNKNGAVAGGGEIREFPHGFDSHKAEMSSENGGHVTNASHDVPVSGTGAPPRV